MTGLTEPARAAANRLMINDTIKPGEAQRLATAAYASDPAAAARIIAPDSPYETWEPPIAAAETDPPAADSDSPNLASYVAELRAACKLTPSHLASKIRINVRDIQRLEAGAYAPGAAVCARLAEVLGGDTETMIRLSGELAARKPTRGRRSVAAVTASSRTVATPPSGDESASPTPIPATPPAVEPATEPPPPTYPRVLWTCATRRIVQVAADCCIVENDDGHDAMGATRWTTLISIDERDAPAEAVS